MTVTAEQLRRFLAGHRIASARLREETLRRRRLLTVEEARTFFRGRSIPDAIIGGLAVQRWGEPRLTRDVDVTVLLPPGREVRLCSAEELIIHKALAGRAQDQTSLDVEYIRRWLDELARVAEEPEIAARFEPIWSERHA